MINLSGKIKELQEHGIFDCLKFGFDIHYRHISLNLFVNNYFKFGKRFS